MAHLITGYAGVPHVLPKDTAAFNKRLVGDGVFVFGGTLSLTMQSENRAKISGNGACIMFQGRQIEIEDEVLAIKQGSVGKYRKDLICMTYELDIDTGIETTYWEVITGTDASTANGINEPEYTYNEISSEITKSQYPVFSVTVHETSIYNTSTLIENKDFPSLKEHIFNESIHFEHQSGAVTPGQYGDFKDMNPAVGESFYVPDFTVDKYGHIQYANTHTVTLPYGGGSTQVDDEFSSTSTNPLTNKKVYATTGDGLEYIQVNADNYYAGYNSYESSNFFVKQDDGTFQQWTDTTGSSTFYNYVDAGKMYVKRDDVSNLTDGFNVLHKDVSEIKNSVLSTFAECQASTNPKDIAGASAVAEAGNLIQGNWIEAGTVTGTNTFNIDLTQYNEVKIVYVGVSGSDTVVVSGSYPTDILDDNGTKQYIIGGWKTGTANTYITRSYVKPRNFAYGDNNIISNTTTHIYVR